MRKKKILIVVGARPNFMKVAPINRELKKDTRFSSILVHTGQHYDSEMSESFFNELNLPNPDIHLGIGSGTHAEQTGSIMIRLEKICFKEKPDLVIVVGDVNSALACALTSAKLCIPVAHVEAGLRSFDRSMPEEINRIIIDQISDYLFTTCEDANENLLKERIPKQKIFFVGNVMIDSLLISIKKSKKSNITEKLGLEKNNKLRRYAVLTLHRPSNVDDPLILKNLLITLNNIAKIIPVIFPIHPRTLKQIRNFRLKKMLNIFRNTSLTELYSPNSKILAISPLGYLDFLKLISNASIVLTDSGGIQEETTILGIPCLTLRKNTERPITVKKGTNFIVGNNSDKIIETTESILKNGIQKKGFPKYWDGKAAKRIFKILNNTL